MEFDILFPTFPTVDNIIRMEGVFPIVGGTARRILETYKEPGAAGNILIVFSRMGGKALTVGPVGYDSEGDFLIEQYKAQGLTTEQIFRVEGYSTPVANCIIDEKGIHTFVSVIGFCEYSTPEHLLGLVDRCRAFCLSGYNLATDQTAGTKLTVNLLRKASQDGRIVFFDPGPLVGTVEPMVLEEVLQKSSVIVLNDEELEIITGISAVEEAAAALSCRTEAYIVAKAGSRGCYVCSAKEPEGRWYKGFTVPLVDTMGCGDSFLGAFMHGWLQGWDMTTCIVFANAAGAVKASKLGTGTKVPTFDEMVAILESNGYNVPSKCKEEKRFSNLCFSA